MTQDRLIPHNSTHLIDELDTRYPAPTITEILHDWGKPEMYAKLSQRLVIERLIAQRDEQQELPDV